MLLLEAYREGVEEKDDVPAPLNLAKRSHPCRALEPPTTRGNFAMCTIASAFT